LVAGSDALVTVAEVAIALAGFSAVVAVFRRTQGAAWTPAEVNGLWIMMEVSFGLIFLSLLPLALEQTALAGKLLWAVACGVLGTFTALAPWVWLFRMHRWGVRARRPYIFRTVFSVSLVGGLVEGSAD
jgi:hypothetical protein